MKPLKLQITVQSGMVNIETPGIDGEGDFFYGGIFDTSGITGSGMQANHIDPEWPELRRIMDEAADVLIRAYNEYQKGVK